MNIKELIDNDGIKLTKQSHREFSGECPWCGGRDRLRVFPDEDGGGSFWCRGCNKGGDAVQYHRLRTGKKYFDACYDLGVEPKFEQRKPKTDTPEKAVSPPLKWKKRAAEFVELSCQILSSDIGIGILEYLNSRGIEKNTAIAAHLGFNPIDRFYSREEWGLPEEINTETSKPKTVWIPSGLVIPCFSCGEPIRIRIRRTEQSDSRYVVVSGSSKQPMRLGTFNRVMVVESDLDAMVVSQEAGDLLSVVSLGSASLRPDAETHSYLKDASSIFLSLDYDQAGAAQTKWWAGHYGSKIKRWPVPAGKDPGEAYQAGINIREWAEAGITN